MITLQRRERRWRIREEKEGCSDGIKLVPKFILQIHRLHRTRYMGKIAHCSIIHESKGLEPGESPSTAHCLNTFWFICSSKHCFCAACETSTVFAF